jgi:hypothetical protein
MFLSTQRSPKIHRLILAKKLPIAACGRNQKILAMKLHEGAQRKHDTKKYLSKKLLEAQKGIGNPGLLSELSCFLLH